MKTFITQDPSALFYETGFSCDNAWLLKIHSEENRVPVCLFITDSRYTLEAKEFCKPGVEIIESDNILNTLCLETKKLGSTPIIYDPTQVHTYSLEVLKSSGASLVPEVKFHQEIRIKKTDAEIQKIQKSQTLNARAYDLLAEFLRKNDTIDDKPITERTLQFQAKIFLQDFGNYDLSFETILAFDGNAAKPHAIPTQTPLKPGNLILLDAGIKFEGYCSDRTRTTSFTPQIHFQKTQYFKDLKHQKVYDIVLRAQEYAIANIRSGMKACEVDALARNQIEKAGYGRFFTHSTGHGIGLDIHELPIISPRSQTLIEDGMVFSIEPGIYIPGEMGVRIEDLVYIKNGRAQII